MSSRKLVIKEIGHQQTGPGLALSSLPSARENPGLGLAAAGASRQLPLTALSLSDSDLPGSPLTTRGWRERDFLLSGAPAGPGPAKPPSVPGRCFGVSGSEGTGRRLVFPGARRSAHVGVFPEPC